MNYGELKTAIANYLHNPNVTNDIPDFIAAAEQRIGRDARLIEQIIQSTPTATNGEITLPTRFVEMISITTGSGASLCVLQAASKEHERLFGSSGNARAYYVADKIYLMPASDQEVSILYYEYPEPMTADPDTRPILDRYESLYIHASLMEANLFLRNPDLFAAHKALYDEEIARANTAAAQAYNPERYSPYNFIASPARGL